MDYYYFMLSIVFLAVFLGAWLLLGILFESRIGVARIEGKEQKLGETGWIPKIVALIGPAAKLTLPKEAWLTSRIRLKMVNAGYHDDHAPVVFFGAKTILAVMLPVAMFILTLPMSRDYGSVTALIVLGAAIGYYTPNIFLILHIKERKREIFNAFPEALDLMVVCVEAGLGLDAAISRVGEEIGRSSPALGEEFHLTNLELRAGHSREAALRNLALRTGVEDINMLVAMLIQSEKFGTSVADSLRIHADSMRNKRMLRAEEAAQKLPVKLIFPVVLLIFPSLFLVLLGPSLLTMVKLLGPMLK